MNLVSIQGKFAPGMQFKGEELHVCHQLIRSLSDNRYLVISSRYRTDILYDSKMEKNQSIIRLWCLYKGRTFDQNWLTRFFRASGSEKSLEHFFTRLLVLKRIPTWYDLYMHELMPIISSGEGKIPKMINDCLEVFAQRGVFDFRENPADNVKKELEYSDTLSIVSEVLSRYNAN